MIYRYPQTLDMTPAGEFLPRPAALSWTARLAIVATLLKAEVISYEWILGGLVIGAGIGSAISLRIPMTQMPERIAFSHAFGGLATALVGLSEFIKTHGYVSRLEMGALGFEVFLGFLTFTGSIMAFGKLQGFITGAPVTYRGQNVVNIGLFFVALIYMFSGIWARAAYSWSRRRRHRPYSSPSDLEDVRRTVPAFVDPVQFGHDYEENRDPSDASEAIAAVHERVYEKVRPDDY